MCGSRALVQLQITFSNPVFVILIIFFDLLKKLCYNKYIKNKGVFNMTYQEEMYAHLVHGGDPQVLLDAFMKDLNEAQKKADEQLAKEKKEAEANEVLKQKREAAVAALTPYISHLLGEEVSEDIIRAGAMEIEKTVDSLKKISVSINGESLKSLFDLLG